MKHVLLVVMCVALLAVSGTTAKSVARNGTAAICKIPNGEELQLGKEKMIVGERTCTMFSCKVAGLNSLNVECVSPQCVNAVRKSEACCYSCPTGYNCYLPGTREVIASTTGYRNSTHYCSCPRVLGLGWQQDLLTAQCVHTTTTQAPTTTTTALPTCSLKLNGTEENLNVGESRVVHYGGECNKYVCEEKGVLKVYVGKCKKVNCNNPVVQPGRCCPSCSGDPEGNEEPESYYLNATVIRVTSLFDFVNEIFSYLARGFGFSISIKNYPSARSSHQDTQGQTNTGKDVDLEGNSGSPDNGTTVKANSSQGSGAGNYQNSGGCKRGSSKTSWSWWNGR